MLSACLGFSDLRVFPVGISVKDRVLEMVGLDFESGLIMGDCVRGDLATKGAGRGKRDHLLGVEGFIVDRVEKRTDMSLSDI